MFTAQSIDQSHYSSTVMLPSLDRFNKPIRYSYCINKILYILCSLHYSHLFVVVTTNKDLTPSQVPNNDLVSYSSESVNMYITTVVRNMSGDQWEKEIVIGNMSNYTHNQVMYYNAPLDKDNIYYIFVRAYAYSHNESVSGSTKTSNT